MKLVYKLINEIKNLVMLAFCLLSLFICLVFVANMSSIVYASSGGNDFNEEYDVLYADIMNRYEQNLITYEEAEAEYITLSQSGAIIQTEGQQNNGGIMPLALTGSRSGNVSWIPSEGAEAVPLRRVKVVLYNGLSGPTLVEIAKTYTDYDGNYTLTYDYPTLGFGTDYQSLSIAVYAESETFRVARSWYSSIMPLLEYSIFSRFDSDINQGDLFNLIYSYEDNERHKAFSISQGMAWAQRYAVDIGGMNQNKKLKVAYPAVGSFSADVAGVFGLSGSYVCGIEAGDWNDWNTVMHEYGHFVQGMKGILGQSLWDYFIYGRYHTGWEDQIQESGNKTHGMQLSWSEAWSYTFAMMAYNQYSAVYGVREEIVDEINAYGGFGNEAVIVDNYANRGEAQENAMVALLWDLFGARNRNLLADTWTPRGHAEFWSVSAQSGTYTMSTFANRLNTVYPQFREQIGTRLSYFKIAPQELTLTNTPNAGIPPTFTWRVNGSQYNPNNQFHIVFYNSSGVQQYETDDLSVSYTVDPANPTRMGLRTATATLTQAQWEAALAAFPNGGIAQVAVKGYLNSSPVSGPYWSTTQSISMNYARLIYSAVSGGYSVTGVLSIPSNGIVDIPETYNGQAVVGIGRGTFKDQSKLTKINIPSSITSVGSGAFANTGVWNNTANNSVVYADKWVVGYKGSISSVTLLPTTIGIGVSAFSGCTSLNKIIIPNSVIRNTLTRVDLKKDELKMVAQIYK